MYPVKCVETHQDLFPTVPCEMCPYPQVVIWWRGYCPPRWCVRKWFPCALTVAYSCLHHDLGLRVLKDNRIQRHTSQHIGPTVNLERYTLCGNHCWQSFSLGASWLGAHIHRVQNQKNSWIFIQPILSGIRPWWWLSHPHPFPHRRHSVEATKHYIHSYTSIKSIWGRLWLWQTRSGSGPAASSLEDALRHRSYTCQPSLTSGLYV